MKSFFAVMAAVLALAGCRRVDERQFEVSVPKAAEGDVAAIKKAISVFAGVRGDTVKFDAGKKVFTLRYDSMQVAKKNIEMAIAKAGFEANGVTPESVGAKPAR